MKNQVCILFDRIAICLAWMVCYLIFPCFSFSVLESAFSSDTFTGFCIFIYFFSISNEQVEVDIQAVDTKD